ncbi:hypothetical protein [Rhizobium sp. SYY.PMSO]|uniref:hypothetical protein n=1 Tax=Rhizobium sp. SYY.PMSO TaxID=3382192 RepID=UPI0013AF6CC0
MRILILSVGGRQLIIVGSQPVRVERAGGLPCGDIRTFFSQKATGITRLISIARRRCDADAPR